MRRALLLPLLALACCGCATGRAPVAPGGVPADFSLDLVLWSPEAPVRYVLFPGGALHWAPGLARPQERLPPLRRVLGPAEIAATWALVDELGLDDPSIAGAAANAKLVEVARGQTVAMATITARGRRWSVLRRAEPGEALDPMAAALVERLAGLAWAAGPEAAPRAPRRYHFGPDPYARYRR